MREQREAAKLPALEETTVCVIGLGYVGLPLAVAFGKRFRTVGVDTKKPRIDELGAGFDRTDEVGPNELGSAHGLTFTTDISQARGCNFFIISVPTPVDSANRPDLRMITGATGAVAGVLKRGDIVVYESTVYPGCTEEDCVPILERSSGLSANTDFYYGYSPERINPGDKGHRLPNIKKVVSGSTPEAARRVAEVYGSVITAGTYLASSVKVAEAAKVIENTQRDINIAFVNELAKIFERMGLDTNEVLDAAATKWNFLNFRPGLVGGHCIGVDPFYLAEKAQSQGYYPEMILAGRRINDSMGPYVAQQVAKLMIRKSQRNADSRILVLGITFKENCSDTRNSKVVDIVRELEEFGYRVEVYDPVAHAEEVQAEYGIHLIDAPRGRYEAIVLAVAHAGFSQVDMESLKAENAVVYDVKGFLPRGAATARL